MEIVVNMDKSVIGMLRHVVIALIFFFFNKAIKPHESEGRKMWLEDLRRPLKLWNKSLGKNAGGC